MPITPPPARAHMQHTPLRTGSRLLPDATGPRCPIPGYVWEEKLKIRGNRDNVRAAIIDVPFGAA
ncbi:MAG: hypothetical protein ACRD2G_18105 [Terriglobia bacterium]